MITTSSLLPSSPSSSSSLPPSSVLPIPPFLLLFPPYSILLNLKAAFPFLVRPPPATGFYSWSLVCVSVCAYVVLPPTLSPLSSPLTAQLPSPFPPVPLSPPAFISPFCTQKSSLDLLLFPLPLSLFSQYQTWYRGIEEEAEAEDRGRRGFLKWRGRRGRKEERQQHFLVPSLLSLSSSERPSPLSCSLSSPLPYFTPWRHPFPFVVQPFLLKNHPNYPRQKEREKGEEKTGSWIPSFPIEQWGHCGEFGGSGGEESMLLFRVHGRYAEIKIVCVHSTVLLLRKQTINRWYRI